MIFHNRLAIHQADQLQPAHIMSKIVAPPPLGKNNLIIYIAIPKVNFDAYFTKIKSSYVKFIHDIVDLPWQRLFRIYDPDGHIVEIGEE